MSMAKKKRTERVLIRKPQLDIKEATVNLLGKDTDKITDGTENFKNCM